MNNARIPPGARYTRTSFIYRDRFLRYVYRDGAEVTIDDAREGIAALREILGPDMPLPITVDIRGLRSQSAEARAHFSSAGGPSIATAIAIIVSSPLSRAIGNFYLGFNKPSKPTRIFSDYTAADQWLEGFSPRVARVA